MDNNPSRAKLVEYKISYRDGDVDHVSSYTAKRIAADPEPAVQAVERVTRDWAEERLRGKVNMILQDEDTEILYERSEERGNLTNRD